LKQSSVLTSATAARCPQFISSTARPSDFLDRWLETVCSLKVREITLHGYQGQIDNLPGTLKAIKVKDLRTDHLQNYYATVTPSTARHLHAVIRAAMRYAVKTSTLQRNPCEHIELPRHRAREIQFLSEADAAKLLAVETITRTEDGKTVTVSNRYRVLFAFLLATAAVRPRRSACNGLT
jgi:site-specific recombinase XerD